MLFFCIVELTNIDPMYQHQGCQELGLLVGVPVTCSFVHLLDSGDYMGRQKKTYTLYLGAKPTIATDRNMGHGMNWSR